MQDGTPPHYTLLVRAWLDNCVCGRWIGRGGPTERLPRSTDLTPMWFFGGDGPKRKPTIENQEPLITWTTNWRYLCHCSSWFFFCGGDGNCMLFFYPGFRNVYKTLGPMLII